jgi:hypothetical protein
MEFIEFILVIISLAVIFITTTTIYIEIYRKHELNRKKHELNRKIYMLASEKEKIEQPMFQSQRETIPVTAGQTNIK